LIPKRFHNLNLKLRQPRPRHAYDTRLCI
jgi:hypothetical protein